MVEIAVVTHDEVVEALREVYDPEIPVNIVDLGLVYDIRVDEGDIDIQMTLTFAGCGMGPYIAQQAEVASRRDRRRRGYQRRARIRPAVDSRNDHPRRARGSSAWTELGAPRTTPTSLRCGHRAPPLSDAPAAAGAP